ncbi:hypothetical protein [Alkalicoccobacillus murimartini]|uniref:DUF3679 domain-containing protein n=1 Tax=Alkalicoccobacillus murimartini TaxID=171685 RepID=A0ABT9YCE1_9BACI|nr:hypothetical protein [Alkalicoccobacillus murimartini]MDQ0205521.1 hypothetical protein [Alkalicoccobacillus murimartini]
MGKKWLVQLGLLMIAILLGAVGGIQYMNEYLGISEPTPLPKQEMVKKEVLEHEPNSRIDLVSKQQVTQEDPHYNVFSQAAMSSATGLQDLTRNLLSTLVNAVEGLNGREEPIDETI